MSFEKLLDLLLRESKAGKTNSSISLSHNDALSGNRKSITFPIVDVNTIKNFKYNKETGEIKSIDVPQRIRQWWFTSDTGKVCIQVKYGSRTIDISKGKNSVEVSSANDLLKALETLKLAAESGEFDVQLESAGLKLKNGFTK